MTLLDRGADVNAVDPDGATALVLAIINYHYDFASMLLDYKADPNMADWHGHGSALFAAVDMASLPLDVWPSRAARGIEDTSPRVD